ncbi:MAG TPA: hypothetical protein PLU06_04915, partial [Candidatus Syntrophosphaera sp.]|nr:hypothetical protein [Candidatus Syntrophosphaera sp.]
MTEPRKHEHPEPSSDPGIEPSANKDRQPDHNTRQPVKPPVKPPRNIVPIIMGLAILLLLMPRPLSAQL